MSRSRFGGGTIAFIVYVAQRDCCRLAASPLPRVECAQRSAQSTTTAASCNSALSSRPGRTRSAAATFACKIDRVRERSEFGRGCKSWSAPATSPPRRSRRAKPLLYPDQDQGASEALQRKRSRPACHHRRSTIRSRISDLGDTTSRYSDFDSRAMDLAISWVSSQEGCSRTWTARCLATGFRARIAKVGPTDGAAQEVERLGGHLGDWSW